MRKAASAGIPKHKMTFSQRRLLAKLAGLPGAALIIEMRDRGTGDPHRDQPTFHGHFYHAACATCGHSKREAANWNVIHALAEAGMIKESMPRSDWYNIVTDLGRSVLRRESAP